SNPHFRAFPISGDSVTLARGPVWRMGGTRRWRCVAPRSTSPARTSNGARCWWPGPNPPTNTPPGHVGGPDFGLHFGGRTEPAFRGGCLPVGGRGMDGRRGRCATPRPGAAVAGGGADRIG